MSSTWAPSEVQFVEMFIAAGAASVHAIEPEPANAAFLRSKFGSDARVTVHEVAASDADGELDLHLSTDPSGNPLPWAHTVLERSRSDQAVWTDSVRVRARSLGSMVEAGLIPARVGILKVDTEGHDLAVMSGMASLDCDVVMVEHWVDLPLFLGPCPWRFEDLESVTAKKGLNNFAFIAHRGEIDVLQWNDSAIPVGAMGNALFVHDRVLDRVLPAVLDCATQLALRTADTAATYARIAAERLEVIAELKADHEVQSRVAAERLAVIESTARDTQKRDAEANANRVLMEELRAELALQTTAAAERLELIEKLERRSA